MIKGLLREIYWYNKDTDVREVAELSAFCPACGFEHAFSIDPHGHGKHGGRDCWTFNGDYEKPTFNPSMGFNLHNQVEHHPRCHSYLINGIWKYLDDCTHGMAGQHVPVPPLDPDTPWKMQKGWHLFPWTDDKGEPLKKTI